MLAVYARREIKESNDSRICFFKFEPWTLTVWVTFDSVVTHKAEVFISRVLANKVLGRIVRKSVNANLFSSIKILSTAYVLCSL